MSALSDQTLGQSWELLNLEHMKTAFVLKYLQFVMPTGAQMIFLEG